MLTRQKRYYWQILPALVALMVVFAVGCTAQSGSPEEGMDEGSMEMEHDDGAMDMEHSHDESQGEGRVPNDGAVIRIVSPQNGTTFNAGDDIVVEVEIENFELNVDGSHWHVYVDGVSYGMVVGDVTRQVLRGIEPGEHTIEAYLAHGTHEELEEPGRVVVVVKE